MRSVKMMAGDVCTKFDAKYWNVCVIEDNPGNTCQQSPLRAENADISHWPHEKMQNHGICTRGRRWLAISFINPHCAQGKMTSRCSKTKLDYAVKNPRGLCLTKCRRCRIRCSYSELTIQKLSRASNPWRCLKAIPSFSQEKMDITHWAHQANDEACKRGRCLAISVSDPDCTQRKMTSRT